MFPGCPVMGYPIRAERLQGIRQMFSPDEDERLKELVNQLGTNNWKLVAKAMPNRSTRQCRERYKNYLSPTLTNSPWTKEEDELLRAKYAEYGPKWAQLATFFQGRSDVNIKNHWTSLSGRELIEQRHAKIDLPQPVHDTSVTTAPVTHPVVVASTIPPYQKSLPPIVPVSNERETIETPSNPEEKKEAGTDVVSAITTIKPVTLQDFSDPLPPLIVKDQAKTKSDNPFGNLTQLLWGTQERSGLLRVEEATLKNDNAGLQNTFPGYGGHIW